ncbi:hypothetical protein [Sulfurimonas sp.]|uniref:hypothetical protein n=1 Tax=Sulfurimonas sp. TaxID=2022749 RepID=UPI0025E52224|nr:hypothetical protein [Sulfurimonas sp.]
MNAETTAQQRARELFLNSATLENDFTPISEKKLSELLEADGIETSASSIGRWKLKFNWKEQLQQNIALAFIDDEKIKETVRASALSEVVHKTTVDIKRNEILMSSSYQVLEHVMQKINEKIENKQGLRQDDIDNALKVFALAGGRADKMLDRLSNQPPEAISSEEVLQRLFGTTLKVEDEDEIIEITIDGEEDE